jgi:mono/diheme cytochrome c family protein
MKNLRLIGLLVMLASSSLFVNCTSDPIAGPEGTAGIDGIDGIAGLDGLDSTADCRACHSAEHRDPIKESFELSVHAAGATVGYAGSRESCSRCHSDEGYVNFITGKTAVDIANPTAISCNTCHDTHRSFDFETDGNDFALRNIEPVALDLTDADYVIDYGDLSNNCISCHQPRSKAPEDDGSGLYLQDDKRFYPHYGGQSTMLEGIQGAIIAEGSTPYPEVGSAGHRKGASCVSCHMGTSTDGLSGSHTYEPSFSAPICATCHDTVPTEVAGLAADMAALHDKLLELGLISEDGSTLVQTTTIPFKSAQALWNYKTVEEDHSNGVHNPKYAKALVKNALEAIQ